MEIEGKMKQTIKLDYINGIKGIAAVGLVIYHYYKQYDSQIGYSLFGLFYDWGWLGVEIFFMISGFLFYISSREKIITYNNSFPEFIKNKIIRLFPLMILTTFVSGVLAWLSIFAGKTSIENNTIFSFILSLFGVQEIGLADGRSFNGQSWFISILLCCYIMAYILCYFTKDSHLFDYFCVGIIIIAIWLIHIQPFQNILFLNKSMGRGNLNFFLGMLIGKFYLSGKQQIKKKVLVLQFCILTLFLIVISFLGEDVIGDKYVVFSVCIAPLILCLPLSVNVIRRLLEMKTFCWLGKISFSIYLWNNPINRLIVLIGEIVGVTLPVNSVLFFILRFFLCIMIPAISFYWIEPYFTKFCHWMFVDIEKD